MREKSWAEGLFGSQHARETPHLARDELEVGQRAALPRRAAFRNALRVFEHFEAPVDPALGNLSAKICSTEEKASREQIDVACRQTVTGCRYDKGFNIVGLRLFHAHEMAQSIHVGVSRELAAHDPFGHSRTKLCK